MRINHLEARHGEPVGSFEGSMLGIAEGRFRHQVQHTRPHENYTKPDADALGYAITISAAMSTLALLFFGFALLGGYIMGPIGFIIPFLASLGCAFGPVCVIITTMQTRAIIRKAKKANGER